MAIAGRPDGVGAARAEVKLPDQRPLLSVWPVLERHVGFASIGDFPTPIEPLSRLVDAGESDWGDSFVKRDDLSSSAYGGNKVRTLEPLFGQARRDGKEWVFATGAYGSNHAVATVLHGARLGFRSGALLFPQPFSRAAELNLRVSLGKADEIIGLLHWSMLPHAAWQLARRQRRRGLPTLIMPPGGASPRGCLGFLSAALELGLQIDAAELPVPAEVVLALGSTCSTAGLLVGLRVAARLGIGFKGPGGTPAPPLLVAVRVTPWPVTSRYRILNLAQRVARWLLQLTGDRVFDLARAELSLGLQVEGGYLGRGYGRPSPAGLEAIERLRPFSAALDTTYAAKSAAAALDRIRRGPACVRLFWSTKSGAALPEVASEALGAAPAGMQRWLAQAAPHG